MALRLNRAVMLALIPTILLTYGDHVLANSETKSFSTPKKTAVIVNSSDLKHRICYYQDQAYSLGALIEVGGYIMRCDNANDFESNGALKWITLDKSNLDHSQP